MTEAERQRAIRLRLSRMDDAMSRPLPRLATGISSVDEALGGGFPGSRIAEVVGPEACGKTMLALRAVARVQQSSGSAAFIDAEHTFDPAYAASLGVILDSLVLAQPEWGERALEIVQSLAASRAVDLIALDSAAALVPKVELQTSLESIAPGLQAVILTRALRRLAATVARTGTCVLFLNQTRSGASPDGQEMTAGGRALKAFATLRVELRPLPGGHRARLRVVKNKLGGVFAEADFDLRGGLPEP